MAKGECFYSRDVQGFVQTLNNLTRSSNASDEVRKAALLLSQFLYDDSASLDEDAVEVGTTKLLEKSGMKLFK